MSDRSVRIERATTVQVNSGDGVTNYNIFVQTPGEAVAVQAALSEGKSLESLDIRGVVHNLPFARNTCFTGREGILESIETAFGQPDTVAITQPHAIHGLGGIGKSQIAMEYAYRHLTEYRYVFWVGAESEAELYKSFSQLAIILDLSVREGREKEILIAAVRSWIENHENWLLIFDNAEDVASLQAYLPRNPVGRVIVTTRSPVMAGMARSVEVDEMEPSSAVEFLFKRANITNADGNEEAAAGDICRLLGYLPLAIDHAGAYVEATRCGLDAYRRYLDEYGIEMLSRERYTLAAYGKTVSATWGISVNKLKETNASAVALLAAAAHLAPDDIPMSLFAAGQEFLPSPLKEVVTEGPQFDEALADLQRYSLIRRRQGERSFSIHRLVQSVIRDSQSEKESKYWVTSLLSCLKATTPDVTDYRNWPVLAGLRSHAEYLFAEAAALGLETETLSRLLNQFVYYLNHMANYAEAEPLCQRALEISKKALGPDHPEVANRLNNLAMLYCAQGRYDEAEPLHMRALKIRRKALPEDHPDIPQSLNNLAALYYAQGRYGDAEPLFQQALKIDEKALGPDHPDVATDLNNLGMLYFDQGRYGEAELLYQRALEISEKALGLDHPNVGTRLNNLAALYYAQGRYVEAEPLFQRALTISEKTVGPDHPDVAIRLSNLAELYRAQGRYDDAEPLLLRALKICEKALPEDHPYIARSLNNLARLYWSQGRYGEAEPLFQRALTISEKTLGSDHPDVANRLNNLAELYRAQGRYDEAEPPYQRALKIFQSSLGEGHPNTITVLENLALFYQEWGKKKKAKEYSWWAEKMKSK